MAFGEYGLKALERGWITNRQIEAARVAMTRKIKRGGKVWINVFPDKPYTKKPAETRMGSGKGNPEGWVAVVKPGRVMFELAGVPEDLAREAIRLAGHKLPIKTKFVKREGRSRREGLRGPRAGRPRAGRAAQAGARGGVQPALPARDRRAREHRRASGGAPRRRAAADRGAPARHRPREGTEAADGRGREERAAAKRRRPRRLRPRSAQAEDRRGGRGAGRERG